MYGLLYRNMMEYIIAVHSKKKWTEIKETLKLDSVRMTIEIKHDKKKRRQVLMI